MKRCVLTASMRAPEVSVRRSGYLVFGPSPATPRRMMRSAESARRCGDDGDMPVPTQETTRPSPAGVVVTGGRRARRRVAARCRHRHGHPGILGCLVVLVSASRLGQPTADQVPDGENHDIQPRPIGAEVVFVTIGGLDQV